MLDRQEMKDRVWLGAEDCDVAEFAAHVERVTNPADYPHAAEIVRNIPVYSGDMLRRTCTDADAARAVMTEFNHVFSTGPGIIAIRGGYEDTALLDEVTDVLSVLIEEEAAARPGKGDHFATAGANSRLWNAHEKLGVRDPALFARYNANDIVRRVAEAWLGPCYQITTQVNVVRPGGKAQTPHRDYHMGFQSEEILRGYPASQHAMSALLTLQGAVAHSDMPLESGPTKLLPWSQSYLPGYIAIHRPDFRAYFEANHVQLPLEKGDMVFFNPATFHAAGENRTTDTQRFANLMQIGSAYGRSIEIVDRSRLTQAVYPHLKTLSESGALTERQVDNVIAATAEGYPFPANLDLDEPVGGMAPASQQDVLRRALAEGWEADRLNAEIQAQDGRKRSH